MNDSPWFVKHKNILRQVALVLLIVSLLGPWAYDRINVPAEYDCDKPFVRLEGDFCGYPMSGILFLEWFAGGFFHIIVELVKGNFTGRSRELITGLSLLLLIPFATTTLLLWKKETPRLRTINLIAWILAFILALTVFILQVTEQNFRLWGLWLYILVAVSAIIFEILLLNEKTVKLREKAPIPYKNP
jgi:hypothetical protein